MTLKWREKTQLTASHLDWVRQAILVISEGRAPVDNQNPCHTQKAIQTHKRTTNKKLGDSLHLYRDITWYS